MGALPQGGDALGGKQILQHKILILSILSIKILGQQ